MVIIMNNKKALEKWNSISTEFQNKLIDNVFCSKEGKATTIIDFTIKNHKYGIVFEGKCKKCGTKVVRVVEDI